MNQNTGEKLQSLAYTIEGNWRKTLRWQEEYLWGTSTGKHVYTTAYVIQFK